MTVHAFFYAEFDDARCESEGKKVDSPLPQKGL